MAPLSSSLFLAACRGERVARPPLWLMRQAGRCLPEYRALKERYSFLELVQTPELAARVTLQPLERFRFDAAILFSDILVLPEALGQPYRFEETGVRMAFPVRDAATVARLEPRGVEERLAYVGQALGLVKKELAGRAALLGFAGSPWTLAQFMVSGGGDARGGGWQCSLSFAREEPLLFGALMEKLSQAAAAFLKMQLRAGAEVVQIFDSLSGLLAPAAYEAASGRWLRQIIAEVRRESEAPVILFVKGPHWRSLAGCGAQVLGLDGTQPLAAARAALPGRVGVQGNLDPALLLTNPERVAAAARALLQEMEMRGAEGYERFLFNLGHGVPPEAKLACIEALVQTIREAS